jgi:hypothetical protein
VIGDTILHEARSGPPGEREAQSILSCSHGDDFRPSVSSRLALCLLPAPPHHQVLALGRASQSFMGPRGGLGSGLGGLSSSRRRHSAAATPLRPSAAKGAGQGEGGSIDR